MSRWLLLAPERDDDEALRVSAWIARETMRLAPHAPMALTGAAAVREAFEAAVASAQGLTGVAFFGHGSEEHLLTADGPTAPALIDTDNVALLRGCWIYAFACLSGATLATRAVVQGATMYVGYRRPLLVSFPPELAQPEFLALVTCVTLALLAGERRGCTLRQAVSAAADDFIAAIAMVPDEHKGIVSLSLLAEQLVNDLVVVAS